MERVLSVRISWKASEEVSLLDMPKKEKETEIIGQIKVSFLRKCRLVEAHSGSW